MKRTFLLTLFLFFKTNVTYAADEYIKEFTLFKETFKAFYNFEEVLNPDLIKDEPNNPKLNRHRAILRDCISNDIGYLYSLFLPIFKKHLTLNELKKLRHNLNTKGGRKYIKLSKGEINESSLTQDEILFINSSFNSPEMLAFVSMTDELVAKTTVLTSEFIEYCTNKERVVK